MITYFKSRYRFFFRGLIRLFLILTLLRVIFYFLFFSDFQDSGLNDVFKAFGLGARFDLRLSALILYPLILLSFLPLQKLTRPLLKLTLILTFTGLYLVYLADFYFYQYLHTRLNSGVLKFFENPQISARMLWQSYPVLPLIVGLIVLVWLTSRLFQWKSFVVHSTSLLSKVTSHVLVFLLSTGLIYGSLSHYPLRWSEAFFSSQTAISNLALNPLLYLKNTFTFKQQTYDLKLVDKHYDQVARFLKIQQRGPRQLHFMRSFKSKPLASKPNIIVIVLESVGAQKSSFFGNKLKPMPHFDALIKESAFFSRFYVPTIATARSIFAAVTSLPDISSVKSSSRNPLIVNQHVIMNQFKGYEKFYFLGGSSNWGNIRGIFSHNVDGMNIYDEDRLTSPRQDVWGVSDYDLFTEAHERLEQEQKPFFAFIQSSGYHRPYTIPSGNYNFQPKKITDYELSEAGFISLEEYNSLHFQDHSLGHFMQLAKNSRYYKNTIFFIFGDHGLPPLNAANLNPTERQLSLSSYHVPLIIHAPQFVQSQVISTIATEMDIMPTAAGLAGIPYSTRTLGKDLFNPVFDERRQAFIYEWYANPPRFGLIDEHFFFRQDTNGKGALFNLEDRTGAHNVAADYPETFKKMQDLSKGLYETTRYLLYHNPRPVKAETLPD